MATMTYLVIDLDQKEREIRAYFYGDILRGLSLFLHCECVEYIKALQMPWIDG